MSSETPLPKRDSTQGRRRRASSQAPAPRPPRPYIPPAPDALESYVPTLKELRDQIAKLAAANSNANAAAVGTINNLSRRVDALAKNDSITATTFHATPFGATSDDALLSERLPADQPEPGQNVVQAATLLQQVIARQIIHPKRFGPHRASTLMDPRCSKIVSIPASGTGGFTDGDMIIVVTPLGKSHKGVIVFSVTPDTTSYSVLDYIFPDKDPEDVGSRLAALYSDLSVEAPQITTGSNVTVVSQLFSEMGVIHSPLGVKPGNVTASSTDHIATEKLDSERKVVHFYADQPESDVLHHNACDPQTITKTTVQNGQLLAHSSAYPDNTGAYNVNCTATDYNSAIASGFSSTLASAWGTTTPLTTAVEIDVWKLSRSQDYLRHILFGDIELSFIGHQANSSGDRVEICAYIQVEAGSGITSEVKYQGNFTATAGDGASMPFRFNTRGNSKYALTRGAVISDIRITAKCFGVNPTVLSLGLDFVPEIKVTFFDVKGSTTYLAAVLTGVMEGNRIKVTSNTDVEVFVNPTAKASTFLSYINDPPYAQGPMEKLIRAHHHTPSEDHYSASSFLKSAGKILRAGGRIGRAAAPFAGPYSGMVKKAANASSALGRLGKSRSAQQQDYSLTPEQYAQAYRGYSASDPDPGPVASEDEGVDSPFYTPTSSLVGYSATDIEDWSEVPEDGQTLIGKLLSLGYGVTLLGDDIAVSPPTSSDVPAPTPSAPAPEDSDPAEARWLLNRQLQAERDRARAASLLEDNPGVLSGRCRPQPPATSEPELPTLLPWLLSRAAVNSPLPSEAEIADFYSWSREAPLTLLLSLRAALAASVGLAPAPPPLASEALPFCGTEQLESLRSRRLTDYSPGGRYHSRTAAQPQPRSDPPSDSGYTATSFGLGPGSHATLRPRFFYPGIRRSAEGNNWAIIPVTSPGILDPEISRALPTASWGAPTEGINGRSGSLAQLLANLHAAGFPALPGLYSGDVSDVVVTTTANQITAVRFTLRPVGDNILKRDAATQAGMTLLGHFPEGWFNGFRFGEPELRDAIGPRATAEAIPLDAHDHSYAVRLARG